MKGTVCLYSPTRRRSRMKCTKCGAETEGDAFCPKCKEPTDGRESQASDKEAFEPSVQAEAEPEVLPQEAEPVNRSDEAGLQQQEEPAQKTADGASVPAAAPAPNKKFTRILTAVIAVLAVVSIGALACVKLTARDPKQVVIDAFEHVWTEEQSIPSEELFGRKAFAESVLTANSETGFTLKMDSCSDPEINQYAGSGLRFQVKSDKTNNKSSLNAGVIYNGMDLLNLNGYYGDETLMVSVPELFESVLTIDLSDGLGERIANSPYFRSLMEENGVDVEGFAAYLSEAVAEAKQEQKEGKAPFDVEALISRYKEGCKAQENFKAALTVEKAEKGSYTMNGREVSCQGYQVNISKESMIDFLRTSSDFFLQDETLKQEFLRQMESTVRMTEIMSGGSSGANVLSAQEMQKQSYDELEKALNDMIDYLDGSLTDIQMTVYVDKKGNLAAVEGFTQLQPEDAGEEDRKKVDLSFGCQLQGGSYLLQNFKGNIALRQDGEEVQIDIVRQGSYDGKKLTDDISVDLNAAVEAYSFVYGSSYNSETGSYHTSAELSDQETQFVKASISGVIDQLEKGKSIHMDIDALEISALDNSVNVVLSGEYYYQPLEGEVTALEGEPMDIVAATESDWNDLGTEIVLNAFSLISQTGISQY